MFDTAKEQVKLYARNHPSVYYATHRLRNRDSEMAVSRATQLVIEGFPRTGNTFSVTAFRQAQKESVRLAHHLHAPAQVIRAARWRVPCLVLIRNPIDAVLSMRIRLPQFSASQALLYYASFYETIIPHRNSYVLGHFEQVTTDFGKVTEQINTRFGTKFVPFEHTEENVREAFLSIEKDYLSKGQRAGIARPSAARKEVKESLRKELITPRNQRLIARAEAVYKSFTSGTNA